jgi:hypothetical protein
MSMNNPSFIAMFMVAHKTLAKMLRIPYSVFQNGIAMILQSSGSVGDNGALSGITALPTIFAHCYMYFPADKIAAGVPAGMYYVQMSSTTVGTIFNNTYTGGEPTIPDSPTPFVTTGPGAYAQTTSTDITLSSFTLPGGSLGARGSLLILQQADHPANANVKTPKIKIGGVQVLGANFTTQTMITRPYVLRNRGAENRNVDNQNGGLNDTTTFTAGYRTLDTSTDLTVLYTANIANAADYFILEGLDAQIRPAA